MARWIVGATLLVLAVFLVWSLAASDPPAPEVAGGLIHRAPERVVTGMRTPTVHDATAVPMTEAIPTADPEDAAGDPVMLAAPAGPPGLSGWLVSPSGQALAGHAVCLFDAAVSFRAAPPLIEVRTDAAGRFDLPEASPVNLRLVVLGPGEGDAWGCRWNFAHDDGRLLPDGLRVNAYEGQLIVSLEEAPLRDVTLVSPVHPVFWVTGRIHGIVRAAPGNSHGSSRSRGGFERADLGVVTARLVRPEGAVSLDEELTDPTGPEPPSAAPPDGPEPRPRGAGPLLTLLPDGGDTWDWDGGTTFVARAEVPDATRLVLRVIGHRPVILDVPAGSPGSLLDVGVLQTEPVGRIVVRVAVPESAGGEPPQAVAVISGGGRDEARLVSRWDVEQGACVIDTDRSYGSCRLSVEAPGCEPAVATVDLVPLDDVEVELHLRRRAE